MNRAERAAEYHKKGYNCAQAIVCAFCDKAGLDEETAFKVSDCLLYTSIENILFKCSAASSSTIS